jgi:hypothetical protein
LRSEIPDERLHGLGVDSADPEGSEFCAFTQ